MSYISVSAWLRLGSFATFTFCRCAKSCIVILIGHRKFRFIGSFILSLPLLKLISCHLTHRARFFCALEDWTCQEPIFASSQTWLDVGMFGNLRNQMNVSLPSATDPVGKHAVPWRTGLVRNPATHSFVSSKTCWDCESLCVSTFWWTSAFSFQPGSETQSPYNRQ